MAPRTAPKQLGGGPSGIVPFSPGKNGSVSISSGFTTGGGTPCVRHDIQVHMMTPTISDHVLLEVLPALLLLLVLPRVTHHYCRARISSSAKHHRVRPGAVHVPCECTHAYAHVVCVYRQIHTYILYKPTARFEPDVLQALHPIFASIFTLLRLTDHSQGLN